MVYWTSVSENKLRSIKNEQTTVLYKLYYDKILARQTYKEATNDVYELVNGYTGNDNPFAQNVPLLLRW